MSSVKDLLLVLRKKFATFIDNNFSDDPKIHAGLVKLCAEISDDKIVLLSTQIKTQEDFDAIVPRIEGYFGSLVPFDQIEDVKRKKLHNYFIALAKVVVNV